MKIHSVSLEYNRLKPSNQFVFKHRLEDEDFTYDSRTGNYISSDWLYQNNIPSDLKLETLGNESYKVSIGLENPLTEEEISELKTKMVKMILIQMHNELRYIQDNYEKDISKANSLLNSINKNKNLG